MKHLKSIIGTVAVLFSIQPLASWALSEVPKTEKASTTKEKVDTTRADKIIVEKAKAGSGEPTRHSPDCPTEV